MGLAIVVLAAGLGTRYGGPKQLAPLGPAGETLLDYTLRDAARAGFSRAVIVVAPELLGAMNEHIEAMRPRIPVRLVVQTADAPTRATPWGTAHATMVGADGLTHPFVVVNADDFYGSDAIAAMAAHLKSPSPTRAASSAAVVGYPADATLSPRGGVSRAVCRVDDDGNLISVAEHTGVRRVDDGRLVSDTAVLDDATLVSMNLWGFEPSFVELLRPVVAEFVAHHADDERELRLPDLVGELIGVGALDVTVLPTTSAWLGVTHPDDAPVVREQLAALAAAEQFVTQVPPVAADPLAHGHIHDTYVVTCRTRDVDERIVLQRLNGDVFGDFDALASNLARITEHLRAIAAARGGEPLVADPIATRAGGWLHVDAAGSTWRAAKYVPGARVSGRDATITSLRRAAQAFAELTRDLDDLGPPALVETIPRFHDFPRRRADLAAAVAADRAGRASGVADLVEQANRLGDFLECELGIAGAAELPQRIVHNDAKLDNVLFDPANGAVAAIVDLDTVMAGTVLNDFGELARTASSRTLEDEPDVTKIALERDRFAALADGYIAGARPFLLDSERACLALAGPLLTLENAVRFLTDHLDGDVYFRVHRPDHNADRARAQLRLANQMIEQLDALRAVIASVA